MGGKEVISNKEISATFINEDDNVDLVLWINISSNTLVDKSDISSLKVEGRVGSCNCVEP